LWETIVRLEGKIAIITGAGQRSGEGTGNGRATAILFAREGAKVVLANRSLDSVEATRDLLRREGYEADCVACDVSKEEDCRALIEHTARTHGSIDILHNNVGVAHPDGDSSKIDHEGWQATLNVNLTGAMLITKHAVPIMRSQRRGCILTPAA
jgi:NAD(P)-dependent dehydrogenase (short-subunit alcohol dehydrogenase family)